MTLKLVRYTEVVHALVPRLTDDVSIVMLGGLAKERPYPGSTTVTTVNGSVSARVKTIAVELARIRIARTPIGHLVSTADIVHAVAMLLENRSVHGFNLDVDG